MSRLNALLDALSALQRRHALLLFLALGALLFAIDGWRHRPAEMRAPAVVGDGADAHQWLEDEVLYREALSRGLDDGDLIIRRRLVQKMRLLLEAGVDVAEPGEAELREWIAQHPSRYGGLARMSFQHVFLSRGKHQAQLAEDAAALAPKLSTTSEAELASLSDPHPGGTLLHAADSRELERLFGSRFAQQIAELPPGDWQGPLPSALGLHFVRILSRETQPPDFAAVRERAQRDWLLEQRRAQTRVALDQLKARHGLATP